MNQIEVINTGTELLLGHVTNTHLGFIAQELFSIGCRINRQTTVPDGESIGIVFDEAWQRSSLIIITGGLGPTSDDITREIVATRLSRKLNYHDDIFEKIQARFRARGLTPGEIVKRQAMVPEGATVLLNHHGTAPGLILEAENKTAILLPGPPRELIPMWRDQVMPWLKLNSPNPSPVLEKQWRILGIGESTVQEMLEQPLRDAGVQEIGYCARSGEVDLRVLSSSSEILIAANQIIRKLVGNYIYSEGTETMEQRVVRLAREQKISLSTAESCTGGLIAHRLTNVPGSSEVFGFGWVTYANEAKIKELGVDPSLLASQGAVSEAVVRLMAEGARRLSGSDLAVAVSGIAGPGGGTDQKPVGTLWIALSSATGTHAQTHKLSRDREAFKQMASQLALDQFCRAMDGRTLAFQGIG